MKVPWIQIPKAMMAMALVAGLSGCTHGRSAALRTVLTDTDGDRHISGPVVTSSDFSLDTPATWSVRRSWLRGGRQDGVELITIDNGVLQITVIPTRGMSILDVRKGEMRLGWDSPVQEVVHPKYIDLESRGGLGWLEGFNEWMVRCGLEFAGHPGLDKFTTNTGDTAEMMLTLHGKVGNIPASRVEVIVDPQPPHRIRVRGTVYERMFYGPKLKLVAEISTLPGGHTFRVEDTVTNLGAFDQEFQLIYHANFGSPLLGKGSTVLAPAGTVAPMNDHAAKGIKAYSTYAGPTKGFIEEVYLLDPLAEANGRTLAVLRNAAGDRAASVRWSIKQLPYLTIWKNTAAVEDGYVTGIEPATGFPFNRSVERKAGRVPKLKPGQTRRFKLDFGLHRGRDAVQRVVRQVSAIQGERRTTVKDSPPATD